MLIHLRASKGDSDNAERMFWFPARKKRRRYQHEPVISSNGWQTPLSADSLAVSARRPGPRKIAVRGIRVIVD
jgi:hypothetical protein